MKINEVKLEIAKQLNTDVSNLDYITDELLNSYESAKEENDEDKIEIEGEEGILAGVYCNSITYDSGTGGYIRYRRVAKGAPNYGSGTERYKKSKTGTTVRQVGSCSGGRKNILFLGKNYCQQCIKIIVVSMLNRNRFSMFKVSI